MNLIEALKSGRRIRNTQLDNHKYKKWHFNKDSNKNIVYDVAAVMSDSWEVEEPKVTIGREDIEKAYLIAIEYPGIAEFKSGLNIMIKELGL